MATANTGPSQKKPQPGWDFTSTTLVQLLGIGLFTVIAGFSDDVGKAMVVIMWGIILGWLLIHTADLSNIVKAL